VNEIEAHLTDTIARNITIRSPEKTKKKAAELAEPSRQSEEPRLRIFLVNVEALSTELGADQLDGTCQRPMTLGYVKQGTRGVLAPQRARRRG